MAVKPSPELVIALGRKGPPGMADKGPPAPSDPSADLRPAMQELMSAIQAGDADAAAKAFQSAHEICASYSE